MSSRHTARSEAKSRQAAAWRCCQWALEEAGGSLKPTLSRPHTPSWFQLYNFLNTLQPSWHWGPRGAGQRSRPGERGLTTQKAKQNPGFYLRLCLRGWDFTGSREEQQNGCDDQSTEERENDREPVAQRQGVTSTVQCSLQSARLGLAFPWGPHSASVH